jgi:hypothetical protein
MNELFMLAPCKKIIEFEEDEHQHHTEAVANLRILRSERV